jgi:hypothetical protein
MEQKDAAQDAPIDVVDIEQPERGSWLERQLAKDWVVLLIGLSLIALLFILWLVYLGGSI